VVSLPRGRERTERLQVASGEQARHSVPITAAVAKMGKRKSGGREELPPDFLATVKRLREAGSHAPAVVASRCRPPSPVAPRHRAIPSGQGQVPAQEQPKCKMPESRRHRTSNHGEVPLDCAHSKEDTRLHGKRRGIPAANFYDSGTANKWDREGLRARMLAARGKKIITRLRAAVRQYRCKNIFREFPLQKEAFAYADSLIADQAAEARVFARELDKKGKRKFFVTTYDECWRRLTRAERTSRHFYEVIREGWLCYLYFDIEFSKELNAETDGHRAMAAFLDFLPRGLRTMYPEHDFKFRKGDIIDLDSSTDAKFSRHLVIRPSAAQIVFKDNIHMGACVRQLVKLIEDEVNGGANAELAHIFVRTSEDEVGAGGEKPRLELKPFIDLGVYTKNRCFRTFQSSKYGKRVVLQDARGCENTYEVHGNDEELFYKSLVCRLAHAPNLLTILQDPNLPPSVEGCKSGARGPAAIAHASAGPGGRGGSGEATVQTYRESGGWEGEGPMTGDEARAWRVIAEHVMDVWNARAGGVKGRIRSVSWISSRSGEGSGSADSAGKREGHVATLKIEGNRWCDRIGRQHKSVSRSRVLLLCPR